MTTKDISLSAMDYLRLRRRQTDGSVSADEVKGISGFADFLVLAAEGFVRHGKDCDGNHDAAELMEIARDLHEQPTTSPR